MVLPKPFYNTSFGSAYLGDSLEIMKELDKRSINLIVTSPPFALRRKKEYGNVEANEYVKWFLQFGKEFKRILADDGSLVIDIGGSWNEGEPTRSLYHFELLISLCKKLRFKLAQEFYWYNPSKLPSPAEWVNVRRIRVKDSVDTVWWLSKRAFPKADNRKILSPYSLSMMGLLKNGYKAKKRPSGHDISEKFQKDNNGAIPPNLLSISNTSSNDYYQRRCREEGIEPHPARFPSKLPETFINFCTDRDDLVLDPFAGSNVTGEVAEKLERRWIAIEIDKTYLRASKFRFEFEQQKLPFSTEFCAPEQY